MTQVWIDPYITTSITAMFRIHYNLHKIIPCNFGVKDAIETMMLQQQVSLGLYRKIKTRGIK